MKRSFEDLRFSVGSEGLTFVFVFLIVFFLSSTVFAAPSITSVSPLSGGPMGGYKLTIHGSGFIRASHVTVGGKICALKSQSVVEIECIVPAYSPAPKPGSPVSVPVVVTVGGLNSNALLFSYVVPFSPFP